MSGKVIKLSKRPEINKDIEIQIIFFPKTFRGSFGTNNKRTPKIAARNANKIVLEINKTISFKLTLKIFSS